MRYNATFQDVASKEFISLEDYIKKMKPGQ
jgi:hypothetical protein